MALVLDTHAVIWYLSGSKQLSPTARAVIESAASPDAGRFLLQLFGFEVRD
jgi:PIN domain nuclease of toxin-antitoxin system